MKQYTKLFILTAFFFFFCLGAEYSGPRFAIYLVKEHYTSLENTELEPVPLLTEHDIVSYEWNNHLVNLNESGAAKIPKEGGKEFIVVVEGQRCYRGAFWSSVFSSSYPYPIIDVIKRDGAINIERAYPSAKFATGDDPRSDIRIKQALESMGKLKNAEPGA